MHSCVVVVDSLCLDCAELPVHHLDESFWLVFSSCAFLLSFSRSPLVSRFLPNGIWSHLSALINECWTLPIPVGSNINNMGSNINNIINNNIIHSNNSIILTHTHRTQAMVCLLWADKAPTWTTWCKAVVVRLPTWVWITGRICWRITWEAFYLISMGWNTTSMSTTNTCSGLLYAIALFGVVSKDSLSILISFCIGMPCFIHSLAALHCSHFFFFSFCFSCALSFLMQ